MRYYFGDRGLEEFLNAFLLTDKSTVNTGLKEYSLNGQIVIRTNVPAVSYTENGFLNIITEMPGLKKEDLSLTVEEGVIIIKGNTKDQTLPKVIDHVAGALHPTKDYVTYVSPTVKFALDRVEREYKDGRVYIKFPLDLGVEQATTFSFE